jgi:hypothetical protein
MMEISTSNGAPFDFFEMFDNIVDSSANAYEKLIALILARHVGKNSEPAYPSRARILEKASCSLATFKRSQATLAAFFTAEPRDGRSTLYAPKPLVTASEIEAAIQSARAESRPQTDTGSLRTRYPTEPGPGIPQSREGAHTDTWGGSNRYLGGLSQIPHKLPLKNPLKKTSPASSEYGTARGTRDEIEGINGATALIVGKLAGWINPMTPDRTTARGWLDSSVKMFGATVVRDSFAEVEAKVMQGDIIARPIPLLTKICQQKSAMKPKQISGNEPAQKPANMAQVVWDKLQADRAAARAKC